MIIDYSFWRPDAAELAGVNGVLRYLSGDAGKRVTPGELGELFGLGLGVGLVFEDTAGRAGQGGPAGHSDGQLARAQMRELGVPAGRPAYAAVDFDVPDYDPGSADARRKLGPVGDYLEAFRAAVSPYGMGVYGGYWLVKRALDASLARWAWQTTAWSGGQVDARIALFQPGIKPPGKDADLDLAGWRDWGQFRHAPAWYAGAEA